MKTTQLKYLLNRFLIAFCFCTGAISLQAQNLIGGSGSGSGNGGNGYSTDLCSSDENMGICITDLIIESDTEGFLVTVTCGGVSQMFAIPVGDAIMIDSDNDNSVDDVLIILEEGSEVYELLYGATSLQNEEMDCYVDTDVVSTNSIALIDDEIPPLQIAGAPFNGSIDIGNWLSNQQFYLVKIVFPNTISSLTTCYIDSPEEVFIPFEACNNTDVSMFTLVPIIIMNWGTVDEHWSLTDVKARYEGEGNPCGGASEMSASSASSSGTAMNFSLGDVESSTIKDHRIDFNLKNDANIEFKIDEGTVCSGKGNFISLPLNVSLAKRRRAGLVNLTFKNENNKELETLTELQVFPNPCSNNLNINYQTKNEEGEEPTESKIEIKVYNSNGNLVKTLQQSMSSNNYQQQINTANWKEGMYYCASYKNGELLAVKPFLKVN